MMVETCGACVETCWLPCQSCACCSFHCGICLCVWKMCYEILCHAIPLPQESTCCGRMMISCCWWNQEEPWVKEAPGDLPLVLGGSPFLLEELSTSPEAREDSCFSLLGLLGYGFSSLKVETWYPFLLSLASSSPLNRGLSPLGNQGISCLAEVSNHDHGVGFPTAVVEEQSLVITQHGDLGEQSLILGAMGNYQVAPIIFPLVGLCQVCMLEQSAAYAGMGMQPWGAAHGVEVVLVLSDNVVTVNPGIYKPVRRVWGYDHYAAKIGN